MSKQEVIIRCDGGQKIGLGHVVRCLALADMLREDFTISFAIQETSDEVKNRILNEGFSVHVLPATEDFEEDLRSFQKLLYPNIVVVLDGYHFKSEYQKSIKNAGCKLACIDDLHAWYQYADIVINHAGGVTEEEYDCEDYTKLLLGYSYALVRKEFRQYQSVIRKINSIGNVFISMGASDEPGNTIKFAKAMLLIPGVEKLNIMVSSINPHLSEIIELYNRNSESIRLHFNISAQELIKILELTDLAICPASTIALEACFICCPLLVGYTAENQLSNYQSLIKMGLANPIYNMNEIDLSGIVAIVQNLNSSIFTTVNQQHIQSQIFKSGSSSEIIHAFKSIARHS